MVMSRELEILLAVLVGVGSFAYLASCVRTALASSGIIEYIFAQICASHAVIWTARLR